MKWGATFIMLKSKLNEIGGRPLSAVSTSFPVLKGKLNGIGEGRLLLLC